MSIINSLENGLTKIEDTNNDESKENGAFVMSDDQTVNTPPRVIKSSFGEVSKLVSKYIVTSPPLSSSVQQTYITKQLVDANTLHQLTSEIIDNERSCRYWKDSSRVPPPPPPMPPKELCFLINEKNVARADFKSQINSAKLALRSVWGKSYKSVNELVDLCEKQSEIKSLTLIEIPRRQIFDEIFKLTERKLKIKRLQEQQTTAKPSIISVAIPLPPPMQSTLASMDILLTLNEEDEKAVVSVRNNYELSKNMVSSNQIATTYVRHENNHNEEELLSLQVLSARSSTPCAQPMLYTSASCDLNNESEHLTPLKDDSNAPKMSLKTTGVTLSKSFPHVGGDSKTEIEVVKSDLRIRYSNSDLHTIRDEICNLKFNQACPSQPLPHIVSCNVIELEARLKRLNIWKNLSDTEDTRYDNHIKSNIYQNCNNKFRSNDLMPAFVKRKFFDESIIRSQPPQPVEFKDPAIITNQRRVGSGRITNNKLSSNYQSKYQTNLSECGQIKREAKLNNDLMDAGENLHKTRTANSMGGKTNYVKRLVSGFLVVSNPKDREKEDNYENYKNEQNDEPEWFSCGPTSRLDTIELCGFAEDDVQQDILTDNNSNKESNRSAVEIRHSDVKSDEGKENHINADKVGPPNKSNWADNRCKYRKYSPKSDLSNNVEEVRNAEMSKLNNDKIYGNSKSGSYVDQSGTDYATIGEGAQNYQNHNTSSRFLPLFGSRPSINGSSEKLENSYSLNEFFKQAMSSHNKTEPAIDKMLQHQRNTYTPCSRSLPNAIINEIPLVDDLEAKWRKNSSSSERDTKISENFVIDCNNNKISCDSQYFKKLINQLSSYSVPKSQQQYSQNNASNSSNINNENLCSLIFKQQKQLNLQPSLGKLQANPLQQECKNVFIQQQQAALLANLQLKSILDRPEAQIYLLRLSKGDISKPGLLVQLANPNLLQREREAITAVLTYTSALQQQNFDAFSNNLIMNQLQNMQNLAIIQHSSVQQQHLSQGASKRLMTLQAMSQEELQNHAGTIMHNAIIKRKIEEQRRTLGLQKIVQLNAAAQVAKHQHQLRNRNMSGAVNLNNQNLDRIADGTRRFQALQNLFSDSNGMVDNIQQQQNRNKTNYRSNHNNDNFQNQRKRTSGTTSGVPAKFGSDVGHQYQQCQLKDSEAHHQLSVNAKKHHSFKTKLNTPSQNSADLLSKSPCNEFN